MIGGGAPALKHCAGAHKMDGLVVTSKLQALKHCVGAAKIAGLEDGRLRSASKELRRRGCILIWSNDRGGAPALKHCTGAHKMDGLVVTSKLQALKHCAGAAKIAGLEDGWLRLHLRNCGGGGVY